MKKLVKAWLVSGVGVAVGALVLVIGGCSAFGPKYSNDPPPEPPRAILRSGDYVVVVFSGVADPLPPIDQRIKENGTITMPFVGDIVAEGKTRGQLQQDLTEAYVPKFFRRLTVTVKTENRFISVRGEINTPGRIPYLGDMTLTRAIAAAGDFTDFARKTRVRLRRPGRNPESFNVVAIQEGRETDPQVYPDDEILVPRRLW